MPNFLELLCLVEDFRIINAYQCFFLNILFDEVDRALGHERKHFVRYHIYRFFLKSVTSDSNPIPRPFSKKN